MARIIYWNNIPSPYVVERLNALARRGCLPFEAWFSQRSAPDRSWAVDEQLWEFRYQYLRGVSIGGSRLAFPKLALGRTAPQLIVGLHVEPAFLAMQPLLRLRGVRTAFWATATYDSWVRRRLWKEAVKRFFFSRVDAVLTTGADGREFALRYRASPRRILTLPHFADFDYFASAGAESRSRRAEIREELGLSGVTFLYVGRLWHGKGIDHLLTAFSRLRATGDEAVSLLLVGDGSDEKPLRQRCRDESIANVIFAGFRQRTAMPSMYAAADVLVFPTLGDPFGHVVEEAMSSALPVVTTSAAGEIRDRVDDGRTGFIVPPADHGALLDRMRLLASDGELRERMGRAALEKARGQTGDRWARAFEDAVERILTLPDPGVGR